MFNEPISITFTITTSRRLDCFLRTIESLKKNCLDSHLITRYLCSDDSSSDADRNRMESAFPNFEFLWGEGGHAASLRRLFAAVTSDYMLHWEDDWEIVRPARLIEMLLDVLWHDRSLKTAILTPYSHGREPQDTALEGRTSRGTPYFVPETGWPGFTLNPALHDVSAIKAAGEYPIVRLHEWTFSTTYKNMGFLVAHMDQYYVHHFAEVTAYPDESCR